MPNVDNYNKSPGTGRDNEAVFGGTISTGNGTSLKEITVQTEIADISTASSTGYIAAPFAGTITKIYSIIDGTITGADAVLTSKINTVDITDGTITVANSGSAAGIVDEATPSAANSVVAGDSISIESNGASTGAVKAVIVFVIAKS
jgi:hypothetical protein